MAISNIAALSSALSLYGLSPTTDSAAAGDPGNVPADPSSDAGPAATLTLSSLHLQTQMVSTLFSGAGSLGGTLDVRV
jgi:hypothetical protein